MNEKRKERKLRQTLFQISFHDIAGEMYLESKFQKMQSRKVQHGRFREVYANQFHAVSISYNLKRGLSQSIFHSIFLPILQKLPLKFDCTLPFSFFKSWATVECLCLSPWFALKTQESATCKFTPRFMISILQQLKKFGCCFFVSFWASGSLFPLYSC